MEALVSRFFARLRGSYRTPLMCRLAHQRIIGAPALWLLPVTATEEGNASTGGRQ